MTCTVTRLEIEIYLLDYFTAYGHSHIHIHRHLVTNYCAITIMIMAILGLIVTVKIVNNSNLHQDDKCDYYY